MKLGIIKDLDSGFYKTAKQAKQDPLLFLTDAVIDELGKSGKDYKGRDLDVKADLRAYADRCFKKFGVAEGDNIISDRLRQFAEDTYGLAKELEARNINPRRDTGEKFFGPGAENSPLFPAFLASSFIASRLSAGLVDLLVFADVTVNRLSVDKVRLNEAEGARRLRNVGLGDQLPQTNLSHVDTNVKMRKYGRMFTYAREVVTMQPLAVIEGHVRQLANQIAIDETDEVIEILHAGDGETGSAVTDTTPATDGTLVYNDLITLELAFSNSYAGQVYAADATSFATIAKMSEYKDPLANRGVKMDRKIPTLPTPTGMGTIYRWPSTNSTYMAETGGRVLGVDPSLAAWVARTALLEEQDTYIDSGKQAVALSYMMAVIKGDPACTKSLDVTA